MIFCKRKAHRGRAGLCVGGLLMVVIGLSIATGAVVEPQPGHYLGSKSSGQVSDAGIYTMVFAIILGVITDISRTLAKGPLPAAGADAA